MTIYRSITIIVIILSICVLLIEKGGRASEKMDQKERIVIDFSRAEDRERWYTINDGVMGGISRSEMILSDSSTAIFQGTVSLKNNGGFASTRIGLHSNPLEGYSGMLLQVRGDGKKYQLRLRTDDRFDGISYRYRFTTQKGIAQTVIASFTEFEPVFRGRVIEDAAPLVPERVQQLGFLIADKQAGAFRLEVDWIKAFK